MAIYKHHGRCLCGLQLAAIRTKVQHSSGKVLPLELKAELPIVTMLESIVAKEILQNLTIMLTKMQTGKSTMEKVIRHRAVKTEINQQLIGQTVVGITPL